ncbi:MAG: alpha/beta hydrolase [Eubacteriales bacterium]|nr:alpha/beta hydrolase [Eubacteriales bacterium]
MKITKEMIHPELRTTGTLLRTFWPEYSVQKFAYCNKFMDSFFKGHAFTKEIEYQQLYTQRPDGTPLRLCVYAPKARRADVPGLVWFHGGGYAIGVPEQDYIFVERFVLASGCIVVMPDYRRSMEAPYPAALDDCYQALLWLKENSVVYGVRPDQLFVGGDSAGGGLSAAVSLLARDRGDVSIAFQMPLYPMLDDRMITASSQDNDAPIWNTVSNIAAWRQYLGDDYGTDNVSKYAAPSRETDYSGLPPTITFVGSIEPFRDETIQYVDHLKTAGVPVTFKLFEGCFHGFDIACPDTLVGKQAAAFLMDGFMHAVAHYTKQQP